MHPRVSDPPLKAAKGGTLVDDRAVIGAGGTDTVLPPPPPVCVYLPYPGPKIPVHIYFVYDGQPSEKRNSAGTKTSRAAACRNEIPSAKQTVAAYEPDFIAHGYHNEWIDQEFHDTANEKNQHQHEYQLETDSDSCSDSESETETECEREIAAVPKSNHVTLGYVSYKPGVHRVVAQHKSAQMTLSSGAPFRASESFFDMASEEGTRTRGLDDVDETKEKVGESPTLDGPPTLGDVSNVAPGIEIGSTPIDLSHQSNAKVFPGQSKLQNSGQAQVVTDKISLAATTRSVSKGSSHEKQSKSADHAQPSSTQPRMSAFEHFEVNGVADSTSLADNPNTVKYHGAQDISERKSKGKGKLVEAITLSGKRYKIFNSMISAAKCAGMKSPPYFSEVLRNGWYRANGYYWRLHSDENAPWVDPLDREGDANGGIVEKRCPTSGRRVKRFNSFFEAAKETSFDSGTTLFKMIRGGTLNDNGFDWSYVQDPTPLKRFRKPIQKQSKKTSVMKRKNPPRIGFEVDKICASTGQVVEHFKSIADAFQSSRSTSRTTFTAGLQNGAFEDEEFVWRRASSPSDSSQESESDATPTPLKRTKMNV